MERFVYQHGLKLNLEKREVMHIGHHAEGRAGHRAGRKETDSTGQFRVPRRGYVRSREDGERGTSKSAGPNERMKIS